jgi:hypothetical protein
VHKTPSIDRHFTWTMNRPKGFDTIHPCQLAHPNTPRTPSDTDKTLIGNVRYRFALWLFHLLRASLDLPNRACRTYKFEVR